MFKSKLEVDRHVNNSLKKINNETERNLRCLSFAKLYFSVGDYEQAYRYTKSYLFVKPKSAEAYLQLGKCLEKLGKTDAALEAYKNSLQIDQKQNNVIIKVCELLSSDNADLDLSGARYFSDLAQSFDPNNIAVLNLREKLLMKTNDSPHKVTQLLLKELEAQPTNVKLRIRLIKHFIQNNMIKEAYTHASAIEEKNIAAFYNNLNWYEVFAEVLLKYQKEQTLTQISWEFWILAVSVLERLVTLSLEEYRYDFQLSTDSLVAIFNFDQMLYQAYQNINSCPDRTLVSIFLKHYTAQLYFHLATLILKQKKKENVELKEASNIVLPLLFTAYHTTPPELNSIWFTQSTESTKNHVRNWYQIACYRCSQTGHVLLGAAKGRKSLLLDKAKQYTTGLWKEQIYKQIFTRRDYLLKIGSSFFVINDSQNVDHIEAIIKLPNCGDLKKYDEVSQLVYPNSLHHYIWIVCNSNIHEVTLKTFDGMQYSTSNLINCAAESLNLLDIYAFIYCAALCANVEQKDNQSSYFTVLPASITKKLSTINQSKFLECAYKMYINDQTSNLADLRVLLIKGIEVVRCVGQHGLDVKLLVALANIFEARSKQLTQSSEIEFTLNRAMIYWQTAIPLLEKIKNGQNIVYPNNRIFEYKSKPLTVTEAVSYLEKGKLFVAVEVMKKKDYEIALNLFHELKDPYASFYQYEIYKKLADQKSNESSEDKSDYKIFLTKARDCLYLTIDRMRGQNYDEFHPLNTQIFTEIQKVEKLLTDTELQEKETDLSDSLNVSMGENYLSNLTLHTPKSQSSFRPNTSYSTPLRLNFERQEARPSPERLDAQIRQILVSTDSSFSLVAQQIRTIIDAQNKLLDKVTVVCDDLKSVKSDVESLKGVATAVNDIKHLVEDFQTTADSIQEIKKDLSNMKKSDTKNSQLSDEDLYVLDNDYGVDYNIGANIPGNFAGYPPGKLPNVNQMPAYAPSMLYPGLYPGLSYYGGLGFAQPDSLPFLPHQAGAGINPNFIPVQGGLPQPVPTIPTNTKFGLEITHPQLPSHTNQISKEETPITSSTTSTTVKVPPISFPLVTSLGKSPPVNVVITTSDPLPSKNVVTSQPVLSVTIPPQHVKGSVIKAPTSSMPELEKDNKIIGYKNSNESYLNFKPINVIPAVEVPKTIVEENEKEVFSGQANLFILNGNTEIERGSGYLKILTHKITGKNRLYMRKDDTLEICANHFIKMDMVLNPNLQNATIFTWIALDFNGKSVHSRETFCVKFKTIEDAKKFSEIFNSISKGNKLPDFKVTEKQIDLPKTTANVPTSSLGGFVFTGTPSFVPKEISKPAVVEISNEPTKATPFSTFIFGKDNLKKADTAKTVPLTFSPVVITQEKDDQNDNAEDDFVPTAEFKPVIPLPEVVDVKTGEENAEVLFEARTKLFRFDGDTKEWKERGVGTIKILKDDTIRLLMRRDQVHKVCCNHRILKDMVFKPSSNNAKAVFWHAQDFSEEVLKTETFTARFKTEEIAKEFLDTLHKLQKSLDDTTANKIDKTKSDTPKIEKLNEDKKIDLLPQKDDKNIKPSGESKPTLGFGDSFKLKPGSWECKACFIRNEINASKCVACDTAKEGSTLQNILTAPTKETLSITKTSEAPKVTFGFGDAFKMKPGTWECKNCFIRNEANVAECIACNTLKEGAAVQSTDNKPKPVIENKWVFGIPPNPTPPVSNIFNQGNISVSNKDPLSLIKPADEPKITYIGFGDSFTPKAETWACNTCFIRNEANVTQCIACNTLKERAIVHCTDNKPGKFFLDALHKFQKSRDESWECKACFIRNVDYASKCVSCDTAKEGSNLQNILTAPTKETVSVTKTSDEPKVTFGFGDAFKMKAGAWECKSCFIRNEANVTQCIACNTIKEGATVQSTDNKPVIENKWVFGIPANPTPPVSNIFNQDKNVLNFGSTITPVKDSAASPTKDNIGFVFGSAQRSGFEFKQRSPRKISTGAGNEESDGSYVEEEEDQIYFKPVIPLPDKVEVTTGEESEDVLFQHRAKLFRFINGEWKERGLGDVKILRNRINKKLRIVMRREQVLKICLNHLLTKDIEYVPKDEKSLLFATADFSEGEIEHHQFCLRFKNKEIADNFLAAVKDAVNQVSKPIEQKEKSEDTDSVEIVFETQVTPEEEATAVRLGLPPKFLSYKQLPDCGCDQCVKDDEYLKDLFLTKPISTSGENIFMPVTPNTTNDVSKTTSFSLKPSVLISPPSNTTSSTSTVSSFKFSPPSKTITFSNTTSSPAAITSKVVSTPNTTTPSLFSAQIATTGNIFSTPSNNTNIFSTPTNNTNIFSNANPKTIFATNFSFGNSTSSNSSIFANPPATNNLFSFNPNSPSSSTSIFGASSNSDSNNPSKFIFGKKIEPPSNTSTAEQPKNLFSTPLFSTSITQDKSLLQSSNEQQKSIFSTPSTVQSSNSFSTQVKEDKTLPLDTTIDKPSTSRFGAPGDEILKCDSTLSFASLAAKTSEKTKPAFLKTDESFVFQGAGAPVFSSFKTKSKDDSSHVESDEEKNAHDNDDYDPHYEPIIPLPESIVVTTGEENEVVLFNERAKLFRYDTETKEWKERGIGQLKILCHNEKHTYRLLLRREQVFKIVLNQLIGSDFDLQPMKTSDNAWMWAGYNYTDDQHSLEKLAVRFKNSSLAIQFKNVIEDVKKLLDLNKQVPVTVQNFDEDDSHVYGTDDNNEEEYDEDDDDEEDDDEDDEKNLAFIKECTLSELESENEWKSVAEGEVQVQYDPDLYVNRIVFADRSGNPLSTTLIGMNTIMNIQDNECSWRGLEYSEDEPRSRCLKVTFETENDAQEFYSNYIEGVNFAEQVGLFDQANDYEAEVELTP